MNTVNTSDKIFWHGYINFYETFFLDFHPTKIAEIGVLNGNSIRWLQNRFPNAKIIGADILPINSNWPTHDNVSYIQMDQSKKSDVEKLFSMGPFDLIIEDGSHIPEHQVLSLLLGITSLNRGGIYILEDIHTSHPAKNTIGNALSILLAIDHCKRIRQAISKEKATAIAKNSLLTPEEVLFLDKNLNSISLYRRAHLPDHCYACESSSYNYSAYKCICGVDIFSDTDSMSFVLTKN
jgi:predicted O-methyltransferase YrrM